MSQDEQTILDEIQRMQRRMDRLFSDMMPSVRWLTVGKPKLWRPPTDVYEIDECVIVKVEIAGMSEQDFDISLSNRSLSIVGARRDSDCKLVCQQLEIPYGRFRTEVLLPYAVAHVEIRATYENGFLTVALPKSKPRRVQIVDKAAQQE